MGEPRSLSLEDLRKLVHKQFPAYVLAPRDGGEGVCVYTLHGYGTTEREALENALTWYTESSERGKSTNLRLMNVERDLASPGMSRERHDALHAQLDDVEACLAEGILTGTINALYVPGITRKVEDLRRRISARLGMAAQDAANWEKAKKHAQAPVAGIRANMTQEEVYAAMVARMRQSS